MATTVETQIETAKQYAALTMAGANSAFSTMRADIANVGFALVSFPGANLPAAPEIPDAFVPPDLYPVDLTFPSEPGAGPTYQDISEIDVDPAPQLDAEAPEFDPVNVPTPAEAFEGTAPTIRTEFDFPTMPSGLQNPYVPVPILGDHVAPTAPTIALPSFDAVAPVNDAVAPTDLSGTFTAAYRDINPVMVTVLEENMDRMLVRVNPQYHTQLAAIEAQLTTYLAGGTGLSPAVEDGIYERSRGKESAEFRRTERAAYASAAARGFTIPSGAAFSAVQRARQAAADNNARSANEIAIKQAEMEQANLQFAVTQSTGLRQAMLSASLSYHGNLVGINAQALDHAKSLAGMLIEQYNIMVRAVQIKLEVYKTEAAVYDTRLKAAMALQVKYESDIRVLQALTDVDQTKVAVYGRRIDAINSLANVYKAQIDAVLGEASLEKNKIDLFRLNVEAYMATVKAKESEFDGYKATLSGQDSQVRLFDSRVRAHGSEVAAYRADIDAQAEVIRAQAVTNQARATQHRAALDAFSALVRARGDKAGLELEVQKAQLNSADLVNRATIASGELASTVYKNNAQIILEDTKLQIDTLIKNADMVAQRAKTVADLGVASGQVYQGMAGAVMSGMNTLLAQTLTD